MTDPDNERLVARTPVRESGGAEVKGRQWPPMTYVGKEQIPEAGLHVDLGWIYQVPQPDAQESEQVLDYDQLLVHIGMDPDTPQNLGATVEFYLGGQRIVFNTTTAIYIPKGIPYGPLTWKEVVRPHLQMSIVFGSSDPYGGSALKVIGASKDAVPAKTDKTDYEQYVVRSPMREAGPDHVEGRQNPTMTYLSGTQVPGVRNYMEIGWIWDVPDRSIPKMRHDNYDEIVLHVGSDPDDPEDLNGILLFGVGEELVELTTTHCVYAPKGVDHGPLFWKEVRRPLLEIAMMLGAGTWAEGWEGSFFDEE